MALVQLLASFHASQASPLPSFVCAIHLTHPLCLSRLHVRSALSAIPGSPLWRMQSLSGKALDFGKTCPSFSLSWASSSLPGPDNTVARVSEARLEFLTYSFLTHSHTGSSYGGDKAQL